MSLESTSSPAMGSAISRGQWMALAAALLGWMFDGFEMGLFPLVGNDALKEFLGNEDAYKGVRAEWFGVITAGFLVGAATGGVLFGWLGDRIGRVRAMTLSVLTYALFTGLCGFATAPWHLLALRFIGALGMGGEWSLGVALVMEVWPGRSRAFMAGMIGAAANVGYLMVGVIGLLLEGTGFDWRTLMFVGAAPAALTFLIRMFVPESDKWKHEKAKGATDHWATRDLLGVVLGATGPMAIIYVWASDHGLPIRVAVTFAGLALAIVGYMYPVFQFIKRSGTSDSGGASTAGAEWAPTCRRMLFAACIGGIALLGTWGSIQWAPKWANEMATKGDASFAKSGAQAGSYTQIASSLGAIVGTVAAAFAGDWLGRRLSYVLMCLASLGAAMALFQLNVAVDWQFLFCVFLAGLCTASFYGWLPLYLPELFPTRWRATGQGFGFNFGRILAAVGTLQTGNLIKNVFDGSHPKACQVMSLIYLAGLVVIWLGPETKGKPLPE